MLLIIVVSLLTCGRQQVAPTLYQMIGRAPSCCSLLSIFQTGCLRFSWLASIDWRSNSIELSAAVSGIVAFGAASVDLIKLLIRIVDTTRNIDPEHRSGRIRCFRLPLL